ncbi:outer membrane beta-barrel family protein [Bacteroides sp. UBA939]|uniref:outer membrane beta-barrel family protein n=1 Tax=Bacteroides sp. UBA939 TaxID=1946092 RepID=UPI0025C52D47|nr:outer membrane beta-barrel family protein [Bacteroides sp. UBA939]
MKRNPFLPLMMLCILNTSLSAQERPANPDPARDERVLSADSLITTDAPLDSLYQSLPEVMITGQRPIVKAEPGKLVYDLPRLILNLPVDNAYDALKHLPGVTEMNGALTLAGRSVTIVLDGKVTTMSPEQLYTLLQTIPAGRIQTAEVMYNAPAHYQVRGALINITLLQSTSSSPSWQGEAYAHYRQKYYENFNQRASLIYNRRRFSADFLYSHTHGRGYVLTNKEALHSQADGSVHHITTHEAGRSRSHTHSFRLGADYNIADAHRLSLVYNGSYTTYHSLMDISGTQQSHTLSNSRNYLHNARFDYLTPFGLKAGAELTYYHSPTNQLLHSVMHTDERAAHGDALASHTDALASHADAPASHADTPASHANTLSFYTKNSQRINRWKFFLAQEHTLKHGWGLNYGAIYTTSIDHSYQYYYDTADGYSHAPADDSHAPADEGATPGNSPAIPGDMASRHREQTLNLYAGFSKTLGSNLSLDVSLAVEHYRTPVWNQWDWYPTINLSYVPSPAQVWQLALSSDKRYPDYWVVQDAVSYLGGGYSEIHGNPFLKPAQQYQLQLTHVLKSKYIFSAWFTHTKDYAIQTLYQSPDRLVEIYKYLNFNYQQQAGLQASIPFNVKQWLNSRLTLMGIWHQERDDDFWDIPFNRRICYGIVSLTNTFTLSSKPDLRLTLTGQAISKATQGIYDLPPSGHVNAALRYGFAGGKSILNLYCNDIFETGQIKPRIRFGTQHVTNNYSCFREFGISFTYKFGGYKEKEREEVDTSRFKN